MDAGEDMIAVRSILDAGRFHCCSLMRGKRSPQDGTTTEQTSSCRTYCRRVKCHVMSWTLGSQVSRR